MRHYRAGYVKRITNNNWRIIGDTDCACTTFIRYYLSADYTADRCRPHDVGRILRPFGKYFPSDSLCQRTDAIIASRKRPTGAIIEAQRIAHARPVKEITTWKHSMSRITRSCPIAIQTPRCRLCDATFFSSSQYAYVFFFFVFMDTTSNRVARCDIRAV